MSGESDAAACTCCTINSAVCTIDNPQQFSRRFHSLQTQMTAIDTSVLDTCVINTLSWYLCLRLRSEVRILSSGYLRYILKVGRFPTTQQPKCPVFKNKHALIFLEDGSLVLHILELITEWVRYSAETVLLFTFCLVRFFNQLICNKRQVTCRL